MTQYCKNQVMAKKHLLLFLGLKERHVAPLLLPFTILKLSTTTCGIVGLIPHATHHSGGRKLHNLKLHILCQQQNVQAYTTCDNNALMELSNGHGICTKTYKPDKHLSCNLCLLEFQGYFLCGQNTMTIPIPFPFSPTNFESCVPPTLQL